jgi:hypothetical protein
VPADLVLCDIFNGFQKGSSEMGIAVKRSSKKKLILRGICQCSKFAVNDIHVEDCVLNCSCWSKIHLQNERDS